MLQKFNSKIYSIIEAVLFRAAFFMDKSGEQWAAGKQPRAAGYLN
jgi:hypothetical protein